MIQWLGLCSFTAEGLGLIPGQGINVPEASQHGQKKEREKERERKEHRVKLPNLTEISLHFHSMLKEKLSSNNV